ncbi:hypothetical protein N4R57_16615 [Rhodobacteraceae bacterium D3-12]|nr:hypothetical protein N4R57_16615 [Rhodobacteraceae bacterium D3-12]
MLFMHRGRDDQTQDKAAHVVARDELAACLLERDQSDAGGLTLEWLIDRDTVEERLM